MADTDSGDGLLELLRWAPLDDPSVLRVAVASLGHLRPDVVMAAAARLRTPVAFDALERMALERTDPDVVEALLHLMVEAGEHERVMRMCEHPGALESARLHDTLIELADAFGSEQRTWLLLRVLIHPKALPQAREKAIERLLPSLSQTEAVELLARLLADGLAPPSFVDYVLWGYLEALEAATGVALLRRLVLQEDARLRHVAYAHIERRATRDLAPALLARLAGGLDPDEVLPLARALARAADHRTESTLLGLVERETGPLRHLALRALGECATGRVVPVIRALAEGQKGALTAEVNAAVARIHERHASRSGALAVALPGHGGLSVSELEVGQLSLVEGEGGELSLVDEQGGALSVVLDAIGSLSVAEEDEA